MFNPAQLDVKYIFIFVKTQFKFLYAITFPDLDHAEVNHFDFLALLHVHIELGKRHDAVVGCCSSSHCSRILLPLKTKI